MADDKEDDKPLKFSDDELKEMDGHKATLEKGYLKQFSYYNRGKPPTDKQKDHTENAAAYAAASRMMAGQKKEDNYDTRAEMSEVGDAAEQAIDDNRKSRRSKLYDKDKK